MPPTAPFTRREFLGSLAVVSAAATVPLFVDDSAWALDAQGNAAGNPHGNRPGIPDDRILLVVQLSGGNDGLNAVPPFAHDDYYRARPRLAISKDQVIKLDDKQGVGLHPQLSDLKGMIDQGLASVVLGVGYPNPNRSHFTSMDIWHTADTNGGKGTGWIGRALDSIRESQAGQLDATTCVCTMSETPLATSGRIVKPIAFERANLFRWTGSDLHPALAAQYDKFNRTVPSDKPGASAPAQPAQASFIMRTALDAQVASEKIRAAINNAPQAPGGGASGGRLGEQLRMVAAMIRAKLPTRIYYVNHGGFDTHANQDGNHGRLLKDLGSAISAFYDELKAQGNRQRVMTMAFSEFGRRVEQNASGGTDHGTAGPVFLFGDMIRTSPTGVLGEQPSLARDHLDKGDLIHNADFRSLYAAILDGWLKVDSRKILGRAFEPAQILNPKVVA